MFCLSFVGVNQIAYVSYEIETINLMTQVEYK
ncbi:hypothetical protein HmCmsJML062_01390 [Escherichia coli]|nr:hypothetical protein HmCmsJML062_01390 [Escherichia coli]